MLIQVKSLCLSYQFPSFPCFPSLPPKQSTHPPPVDLTATILGVKTELPIYLSAVAMCGMGHADGEIAWTKAAGEEGIMFMVPNLSSKPFEKIIEPALDEQALMYGKKREARERGGSGVSRVAFRKRARSCPLIFEFVHVLVPCISPTYHCSLPSHRFLTSHWSPPFASLVASPHCS